MTARSEFSRVVRGLAATLLTSNGPGDAAALRDAVINNTNHLLDERGQVVAWMTGAWIPHDDDDVTEWNQLFALPDLIFPITVLSSGDTTKLIVELKGNVDGGAGTVLFRVQLMPLRGGGALAETGDLCAEVSTTSTTATLLEPSAIYVTADELGDYARESPAPTSAWRNSHYQHPTLDADGNAERIKTVIVRLRVWAQRSSGTGQPKLVGITVREFIGG